MILHEFFVRQCADVSLHVVLIQLVGGSANSLHIFSYHFHKGFWKRVQGHYK
jgi:hypothetical protein